MNKEFLKSLEKDIPEYERIFNKLYQGVIETNKLIGIGLDDITEEQRLALIDTYFKLRIEEGKEVEEAIEKEDKVNLLNELIDVLVVAGYEYYLDTGYSFSKYNKKEGWEPDSQDLQYDLLGCTYCCANPFLCEDSLLHVQDALTKMGCNVEKAVEAVLQANLSKFPTGKELTNAWGCPSEEVTYVLNGQTTNLEVGGRYTGVTVEEVEDCTGETRYVFWSTEEYGNPKRKYLKPLTFIKAELEDCW